jgi:hypothetical protein
LLENVKSFLRINQKSCLKTIKYDKIVYMKAKKTITIFLLFLIISGFLQAQDHRSMPLDLYLIIDASEKFRETRDESAAWINEQIIERLLQEGDRLVIWSAGDTATIIHTETIGASKEEAKNKVASLDTRGRSADFGGALREASSRAAAGGANRLSMTLLISGSAETLASSLGAGSGLCRWSRVEQYSRWQALVIAPAIGDKVRRAAAAFMSSR